MLWSNLTREKPTGLRIVQIFNFWWAFRYTFKHEYKLKVEKVGGLRIPASPH